MISNWTDYLTPKQVLAVVEKLKTQAENFVSNTFDNEKELKAYFEKLPENFFKMLIRKKYHEVHGTIIDNVLIDDIFKQFGNCAVDWSRCRIQSLSMYSDLLKVWNSICPIKYLQLNENQITKIEGFDGLTSLERLLLVGNMITKIEGLDSLENLTELKLGDNRITKIEGLNCQTNLMHLDLANNLITKIESLDRLIHLRYLWLNHNKGLSNQDNFVAIIQQFKNRGTFVNL